MHDVIIIGAGASGCFLAINLKIKNPKLDVLLLEKNEKLGKKILITGNGRCNLGNENEDLKNYNSTSKLDEFNTRLKNNNYLTLLNKIGILTKKEETSSRVYPYSNQAITVCKSFERALEENKVSIKYNYDVKKVKKENETFVINDELRCNKLVIATGGKSYSKTGSTGDGYKILKSFGHKITDLYTSLTYLKTSYKYIKDLAGVRVNGLVKLVIDEKEKLCETGQIQFTKDSLSGICIFNLSRNVSKYIKENKNVNVVADIMPEYKVLELENYLLQFSNYKIEDALSCMINNKISVVITRELNIHGKKVCNLNHDQINKVCFKLKNMKFKITSVGDFESAQVTNGGAYLKEFTPFLESKLVPNLYSVGEVLDVDGKCGGYNLSWAFNSALIVAEKIVIMYLKK